MANRTRRRSSRAIGSKISTSANGAPGNDLTKTDKAHQAIKRAIVKGELTEGTFLSEGAVIQKYGVGRTPFREACNRLIHEGLLEIVPRRGYLVPELSFHDVRDLFELGVLLESAMIELATLRASHEEIQELSRLAAEAPKRRKGGTNGFEAIIEANKRFHLKLAKTTRNRELQRLLASVLERTERVMFLELRFTRCDADAFKMIHEPIIEADAKARREGRSRGIAPRHCTGPGRDFRPAAARPSTSRQPESVAGAASHAASDHSTVGFRCRRTRNNGPSVGALSDPRSRSSGG